METENVIENSTAKLKKKKVNMICANSIKADGAGFGTDTNIISIITNEGVKELPKISKFEAANAILDEIKKRLPAG